eukprot:Nk52_evm34s355 gene=Nk52_evmTU34s355
MLFSNQLTLLYTATLITLISTTRSFAKPTLGDNADIQAALKAYQAIAPLPTPWHAILFVNLEKANAMWANIYTKNKNQFLSSFQYTEKNATALHWPKGSYAQMDATFGPPRLQFLSDGKMQLEMTASAGSKVISSFCSSYNTQTKGCNEGKSAITTKDITNEVFTTEVKMAQMTESLTNGTLVLDLNSITHWQFTPNAPGFDSLAGYMLAKHMQQKHTNKDYTLIRVQNVEQGMLKGLIPTGVKYRPVQDRTKGVNSQNYVALFIMTQNIPLSNDLTLPEKLDFIPAGRDFTLIIPNKHFTGIVGEDMAAANQVSGLSYGKSGTYEQYISGGNWDTKVVLHNFGLKCSSGMYPSVISGDYDISVSLSGGTVPSSSTQSMGFHLTKVLPIVVDDVTRAGNNCDDQGKAPIAIDLTLTFGVQADGTISVTPSTVDKTHYAKPNYFNPNFNQWNSLIKGAIDDVVSKFKPNIPSLKTFPLVQYGLPDQSKLLFEDFNILKDAIAFGKRI